MNDAVYKFKRYEDASLEYIGLNKHKGDGIGLYDTVLSAKDYYATFENVTGITKSEGGFIYESKTT